MESYIIVTTVSVHLLNGIWGSLAVGIFAADTGLLTTGEFGQLIVQLIGVAACGSWTATTAFLMFAGIKATVGLRVTPEEEELGLDSGEHGTSAYPDFAASGTPALAGEAGV